jgi:hypothetical protein
VGHQKIIRMMRNVRFLKWLLLYEKAFYNAILKYRQPNGKKPDSEFKMLREWMEKGLPFNRID